MNVEEKIFMFENQIALLEAALGNAKTGTAMKSLEYRIKQTKKLLKSNYKFVEFDNKLNSMTKEDWENVEMNSMTSEDWDNWYENVEMKRINQNKMTAVEWLWNALLVSGFEEIKNVEGFYHLAKQKEKEQNNAKIQKAIELFEEAKRQADIAKDVIYLDGVLAVLDGIKNTN